MADLVEKIEGDIRKRADELRPSVLEYEILERARQALDTADEPRPANGRRRTGGSTRAPSRATKARATRSKPASRSSTRGAPAAKGERSKTVLALLSGNPEIAAANVAMLLDISPQNAHATIYRLRKQGRVDRKGGRWVVSGS